MATVHKTVEIARPVDDVWKVVGDIVAWTVEVEPDEQASMMEQTFDQARPALRQTLENPS